MVVARFEGMKKPILAGELSAAKAAFFTSQYETPAGLCFCDPGRMSVGYSNIFGRSVLGSTKADFCN